MAITAATTADLAWLAPILGRAIDRQGRTGYLSGMKGDASFLLAQDAEVDRDGLLLRAYAEGDAGAARQLTASLAPRAFSQAHRMLADRAEAEDVVQEALLRLWKIAPDWRQGEARVSTWLYRVVANLATDKLRARTRLRPLESVVEPEDGRPSVAAGMMQSARHTALADALADLPGRQAEAVSLRHLEGLSNPEIAAIMDISVEAVESLTARGKRALAQRLAPRQAELGWTDD
jgi:RNA polymerase sigma-70 factor (ECF subfamily)